MTTNFILYLYYLCGCVAVNKIQSQPMRNGRSTPFPGQASPGLFKSGKHDFEKATSDQTENGFELNEQRIEHMYAQIEQKQVRLNNLLKDGIIFKAEWEHVQKNLNLAREKCAYLLEKRTTSEKTIN